MIISDLIQRLEELKEKHGDLPVLIEQVYKDAEPRMSVQKVTAELTQFDDMDWETVEAMEERNIVNSVVISDEP